MQQKMMSSLSASMGVAISFLLLSACGSPRDHDQRAPTSESVSIPTETPNQPSPRPESNHDTRPGESLPKARHEVPETGKAETGATPHFEQDQPRTIQIVIKPLRTNFGVPYGAEARDESSSTLLAKAEQVAMQGQVLEVEEVQYSSAGTIIYRGKLFFEGGELIRQERIEGNQKWKIFTSWNLQHPY